MRRNDLLSAGLCNYGNNSCLYINVYEDDIPQSSVRPATRIHILQHPVPFLLTLFHQEGWPQSSMPLWITSSLLHDSSCETDTADSFHFFLFPLNFISEILTEVIYNLSGECLGNWKKVKNNNDDDNSREIKDRDGVFISNGYVLKRYSVSVSSNTSLNA
jgi:hypothetical protein